MCTVCFLCPGSSVAFFLGNQILTPDRSHKENSTSAPATANGDGKQGGISPETANNSLTVATETVSPAGKGKNNLNVTGSLPMMSRASSTATKDEDSDSDISNMIKQEINEKHRGEYIFGDVIVVSLCNFYVYLPSCSFSEVFRTDSTVYKSISHRLNGIQQYFT